MSTLMNQGGKLQKAVEGAVVGAFWTGYAVFIFWGIKLIIIYGLEVSEQPWHELPILVKVTIASAIAGAILFGVTRLVLPDNYWTINAQVWMTLWGMVGGGYLGKFFFQERAVHWISQAKPDSPAILLALVLPLGGGLIGGLLVGYIPRFFIPFLSPILYGESSIRNHDNPL
ncbi:hypothetical protein HYR99_02005 [Candidatus Poribacteria bacterium]|nr:hypothetical protein [Candidatus Poribacteria bacterium]